LASIVKNGEFTPRDRNCVTAVGENSSKAGFRADELDILRTRALYAKAKRDVELTIIANLQVASNDEFSQSLLRYPNDMVKCMAAFQIAPSFLSP
jgi:hypothetical protein